MKRACLVLAVVVGGFTGAAAVTSAAPPPVLKPVALRRDHGAHPAFQDEWWYTAGTVAGPRGRNFFWFATVWTGMGFKLARVNLVDLRADRVVLSREYVATGALGPGQTDIQAGAFTLAWQPAGRLGRWTVAAQVPGAGRLELTLVPLRPYVFNGTRGIVPEGPGATSAYYSAPRLAAYGTLVLHGHRTAIGGEGWLTTSGATSPPTQPPGTGTGSPANSPTAAT